jgi:tRNA (adenine57-N1/adenine58-N1)-methyltransferase
LILEETIQHLDNNSTQNPMENDHDNCAQAGDFIQLTSPNKKNHFLELSVGGQLQTHRGTIQFDNIIGKPWGSEILTHTGSPYYLLNPSIHDLLLEIPRNTQIMYPKDIGFVLLRMGIGEGHTIIEAGTGSGALTTAFAWYVGSKGNVISYEIRTDMLNLARKNLERVKLATRVVLKQQDIRHGFEEKNIDAIFLDVHNAYDFIHHVRKSLKPGGHFGCIMPTTNQVSKTIEALRQYTFVLIDVCEIMLRYYKPVPGRLRPTDRMVAHTGYLIFARSGLSSKQ